MTPLIRRQAFVEILVPQKRISSIDAIRVKKESDAVKHEATVAPKGLSIASTSAVRDRKPPKTKKEKKEENEVNSNLKFVKEEPEDVKIDLKFDIDRPIPPSFDIPKEAQPILHACASREYFSKLYGGNVQDSFPRIRPEKWEEHKINFMFVNPNFHPNAPSEPGAGGLFFDTPLPGDHRGIEYHVIERMQAHLWKYLGQYKLKQQLSLTADEWNAQREGVKGSWTHKMQRKQWGSSTKAFALLGKRLGRRPTKAEVEATMEEHSTPKGYQFPEVTIEMLREGFANGWVFLTVYTIECVGYDLAFQEKVARDAPGFQAETDRKVKVKKEELDEKKLLADSPTPESRRKVGPPKPMSRKRKADEAFDGGDRTGLSYVPRGTRSRPKS